MPEKWQVINFLPCQDLSEVLLQDPHPFLCAVLFRFRTEGLLGWQGRNGDPMEFGSRLQDLVECFELRVPPVHNVRLVPLEWQ